MQAKASTLPFPKVGITLRIFDLFIEECGGRAALDGMTTSDVCERHLKPLTAPDGSSYCELKAKLHPRDIGIATVFISHAWKLAFLDVVDTLKYHFRHTSRSTILWFDLFSNNQHAAVDLDFGWWSTTFKSAIAKFGRTVVVLSPWYNPFPLLRAWCLYEIFCSIDCGSKLELAMTRLDEANFVQSVKEDSYVVLKMIGTINLEKSEAFNPADKDRIFDVVRSTVGFDALNSAIFERLRVWVIEAIEGAIESADTTSDQLLLKFGLASLLRQQGRFRESDAHFLNCIQEQRLLGDDAGVLARFLNGYGYALWSQNRFEEAEPYILESFDTRKLLLGLDNDDTLASLNTLCQLYRAQKRFDEAEPLSRDLVERRKKLLGEDHNNYLKSLHGLAQLYILMKKYDEAKPLCIEVYERRLKNCGSEDSDTISSLFGLATLYENLNEDVLALEHHQRCYDVRRVQKGLDNPETFKSMHAVAVLLIKLGKGDAAKELLRECLKRRRLVLGDEADETMKTRRVLEENFLE